MSCVASLPWTSVSPSVVFLLNCEYILLRGCHVASLILPPKRLRTEGRWAGLSYPLWGAVEMALRALPASNPPKEETREAERPQLAEVGALDLSMNKSQVNQS